LKAFLRNQGQQGHALARKSPILSLLPMAGDPPTDYIAEFTCRGLAKNRAGEIIEHDLWAIYISFPDHYLRGPVEVPRVLTYLGSAPRPWHPNIRPPFVCLHLYPGMGLVEILYGLHDLLTYNLFATSDEGLNHAASQWARREDPTRFPIDRRPLQGQLHHPQP
jgi:hypothetical protein